MEGHLISSLAQRTDENAQQFTLSGVELPVLALLISGGHTEFDLMSEWFHYTLVGQTLDDAVGEAYDKVARMLGLPYPGGPQISKLAQQARIGSAQIELHHPGDTSPAPHTAPLVVLPRPMLKSNTNDFSFSGLKTAVLYALRTVQGEPPRALSDSEKAAFAREFEDAVTEVFVVKTRKALEEIGAKTFVIGGGVAANVHIRMALESLCKDEFPDVDMRLPELSITGDNAVMIAEAARARALSGIDDTPKGEVRAYSNRFSMQAPQ
jgi:N6-L-threonylcarbamoyladenine synthase